MTHKECIDQLGLIRSLVDNLIKELNEGSEKVSSTVTPVNKYTSPSEPTVKKPNSKMDPDAIVTNGYNSYDDSSKFPNMW